MRARAGMLTLALLATAAPLRGQRYHAEGRFPPRFAPEGSFDRGLTFCRLMYESDRREMGGIGWVTDYPYAEINFMTRVAELTTAGVNFEKSELPNYYVVRPADDALFQCPFLMATDVGTVRFSLEEAARLRSYLLKGGFLWVDDFWGEWAWQQWSAEIGKVLPPREYPIVEVPLTDPLFSTLYELTRMPQITSIQFWRRSGGTTTSERGEESATPHLRAIRDARGRIMVLMSFNTDIGDAWERETEDIEFFYKFAHDGYALGIDALLHAMSH
ncbi:MAG: DUF4159 domain-containing protein [Gemmatimonadetes bacterium]|nr:DUF4159 domain-containing protein [Gemmatimonadota bacterium]